MDEETFWKMIDRKKEVERRLKMLELIRSGDAGEEEPFVDLLFEGEVPREEYVSPIDRDTRNYGYMETDEMTVDNPNAW